MVEKRFRVGIIVGDYQSTKSQPSTHIYLKVSSSIGLTRLLNPQQFLPHPLPLSPPPRPCTGMLLYPQLPRLRPWHRRRWPQRCDSRNTCWRPGNSQTGRMVRYMRVSVRVARERRPGTRRRRVRVPRRIICIFGCESRWVWDI